MGSLPYGKSLLPRPLAACRRADRRRRGGGRRLVRRRPADRHTGRRRADRAGDDRQVRQRPSSKLRAGWTAEKKVPRVPGLEAANARALAPADGGRGRMVITLLAGETAAIPQATLDALRVPLPQARAGDDRRRARQGYTALSLRGVSGLDRPLQRQDRRRPADDRLHRAAGRPARPPGSCPADITTLAVTVPPRTGGHRRR